MVFVWCSSGIVATFRSLYGIIIYTVFIPFCSIFCIDFHLKVCYNNKRYSIVIYLKSLSRLLQFLLDVSVFYSLFGFRLSAFYLHLLNLYLLSFSLFYRRGYRSAFITESFKGFQCVYYRFTRFTNLLRVNRLFTLSVYCLFNFQATVFLRLL